MLNIQKKNNLTLAKQLTNVENLQSIYSVLVLMTCVYQISFVSLGLSLLGFKQSNLHMDRVKRIWYL